MTHVNTLQGKMKSKGLVDFFRILIPFLMRGMGVSDKIANRIFSIVLGFINLCFENSKLLKDY